ncbi:anti-sigma factor, partial [Mesorhizobium sp. M0913]
MSAHNDGLPDDPAGVELMIHALVDGELDAAAALAVERRIAADPALAAEHARIVALQSAVGRLALPQGSDALNARIAAIGATGEAQARPGPPPPPPTRRPPKTPTQNPPARSAAVARRAHAG